MHRTDADGHDSGLFTDGNPSLGVEATVVDASWLNDVQEELVHVILTKAGITLVEGTQTQFGAALDLIMNGVTPGGRLTLTTGVPVTTADVTGATTIRYTPYKSDRIMLWDGTRWVWRAFTELSQATTDSTKSPAALSTNQNVDLFVWDDNGTLRCTRGPTWATGGGGDTARGTGAGSTELEMFGGRWVNKQNLTNGPTARKGLYVGTIRSDGSSQVNDSLAKRHVWNMYNRVPRPLKVVEGTNTWSYLTGTLRQANGAATNQLDYVVGLAEEPVFARVIAASSNTDGGASPRNVGIGVDSTTVDSSDLRSHAGTVANLITPHEASYEGFPGLGRHLLVWLEQGGGGVGATTWYGDNGGAYLQSGIVGRVFA